MADDFVYGICSDCLHTYTEPIDNFDKWLPKGCPSCGSKREPYPVRDDDLPPGPDLIPMSVSEFFAASKAVIALVLLRDMGYRLGVWVSEERPTTGGEERWLNEGSVRFFAIGTPDGARMALTPEMVSACWRVGDRPGHHG